MRHNPATGLHELLKGLDPSKGPELLLHRLNQAQLSKTMFPVGELHKTEVRRIAEEIGLPNARKGFHRHLLHWRAALPRIFEPLHQPRARPHPGRPGRKLGQHVGLSFYTLGQRQGIGGVGKRRGEGKVCQRWRRRP